MEIRSAIDFYERHPISSEIILAKLSASRRHLNDVAPEELFPHDQDHYGGLEANDTLAARAAIGKGTRVVDFCAGLGGPSRYLAHRYGADVTGIELTPARLKGAEELTRLVGLQNEAIAEAVQRPTMKFVATRSAEQLDLQALHRVRERLVSQRTGIINQIRAFLLERGIAVRQRQNAGLA